MPRYAQFLVMLAVVPMLALGSKAIGQSAQVTPLAMAGDKATVLDLEIGSIRLSVLLTAGIGLQFTSGRDELFEDSPSKNGKSVFSERITNHQKPVSLTRISIDIAKLCAARTTLHCQYAARKGSRPGYISSLNLFRFPQSVSHITMRNPPERVNYPSFAKSHLIVEGVTMAPLSNSHGNQYDCPRDGAFGNCRFIALLSDDVLFEMVAWRTQDRFSLKEMNAFRTESLRILREIVKFKR